VRPNLACFAAFAGRFDVYYGFPDDYGLETENDRIAAISNSSGFTAFRGMTLIYIISRAVLAAQYLLLYYYAIRQRYPAQAQFLWQIGVLVLSAAMWIGSYFLERNNANAAMRIAKYGLWYGALAIEMVTNVVVWRVCPVTGFRRTHLTERFAILTLLILGEGVIGYAIALQSSRALRENKLTEVISGVGFGPPSGLAIVMVCLTIYLLWVYYFSTFTEHKQYNVLRAYGWVLSSLTY
jgi:low temperature requirement protein LtrA